MTKKETKKKDIYISGVILRKPLGFFSFLIPKTIRIKKSSLKEASHIFNENTGELVEVKKIKVSNDARLSRYNLNGFVKFAHILHDRYIYDKILDRFIIPTPPDIMKMSIDSILASSQKIERASDIVFYGKNELCIDLKTVLSILIDNVNNLLYFITIVSMINYIFIDYMVYLTAIYIIVIWSLYTDIASEVDAQQGIVKIAGRGKNVVVLDGTKWAEIDSKLLVPGDIMQIEKENAFPVDARIIAGECVIDESFLTGECVPVNKTCDMVVYAGTKVLMSKSEVDFEYSKVANDKLVVVKNFARTKKTKTDDKKVEKSVSVGVGRCENAIGVCISTGFGTTKGKLLKNLLLVGPPDVQFYREASSIIKNLLFIGLPVLAIFLIYCTLALKMTIGYCVRYGFDLLFVLITPSLSTSILVGTSIAFERLKKCKIFCFCKERINSAGYTDLCVFDKTGTITEIGLDMHGIDNINNFKDSLTDCCIETRIGLSCCHELVTVDGELMGDPLDVRMFNFSEALKKEKEIQLQIGEATKISSLENIDDIVKENESSKKVIKTSKVFEFDTNLRRMSVLVEYDDEKMLFTKGSPESIKLLLNEIPEEYDETVNEYGLDGYRVLSLCCKKVSSFDGERKDFEKNLNFLTFIIFANRPKPASNDVITQLRNANIKTMMATGDNILTAISVARQVGMIDESVPVLFPRINDESNDNSEIEWLCISDDELLFDKIKLCLYSHEDRETYTDFIVAMEGREYDFFRVQKYYSEFMKTKAIIFARMNPDQKKSLIEDMAEYYTTCFCGDGANDCGALKAAEVGISLCSGEVSIAGTFSSEIKDISCVLDVIKQGRAALVGSICRFKFILMSSLTLYVSLLVLVYHSNYFSDAQEIYFDILSVLTISYFMSSFKASEILSKRIPVLIILNFQTFIFMFLSLMVTVISSVVFSVMNSRGEVGKTFIPKSETITGVFFIIIFKIFTIGFLFSEGNPHREPVLKNLPFLTFFFGMFSLNLFLFFSMKIASFGAFFNYFNVACVKSESLSLLFGLIFSNCLFDVGLWTWLGKTAGKRIECVE